MHAIIDTISDADHGQFECTADNVSPFMVHCCDPRNNVLFNIEVVTAPVELVNCVRIHKVSGSPWRYVSTMRYITHLIQATLEL